MKADQIRRELHVRPSRRTRGYRDPVLTWRRRGCGCRLLRAWIDSRGWHVVGDDYFPPGDWDSATNSPSPAHRWDLHKRRGVVLDLPLDPRDWDRSRSLLVGCEHTGTTDLTLGRLAARAREVRATQSVVDQRIDLAT